MKTKFIKNRLSDCSFFFTIRTAIILHVGKNITPCSISKFETLIGETYFSYYQNFLMEFSQELEPFVVGGNNVQA